MNNLRIGTRKTGVETRGDGFLRREKSIDKGIGRGASKPSAREPAKRPLSRIAGGTAKKNASIRFGHGWEDNHELMNMGNEIKPPTVHPVERRNSRGPPTGRGLNDQTNTIRGTTSNLRAFKVKDKQIYNKVWHPQEEEHHPPQRAGRYDRGTSEEEVLDVSKDAGHRDRERGLMQHLSIRPPAAHNLDLSPADQKTFNLQRGYFKNNSPQGAPKVEFQQALDQKAFRITKRQHMTGGPVKAHEDAVLRPPDSPNFDHSMTVEVPKEEVIFDTYEGNDESLLNGLTQYFERFTNKNLISCQEVEVEKLRQSFDLPTWACAWVKKKYVGDKLTDTLLDGLLIYQLDISHFKSRRLKITHISCTNYEKNFESYLKEAVRHIFTTDSCTEIFLEFKHIKDSEDKLYLPPDIKEATKVAGFKWRMMITSEHGTRMVVFEAKRGEQYENPLKEVCLEAVKQIGYSIVSNKEVETMRDLLSSERHFRVPYDRLLLTFAAFAKYTDNTYKTITSEKLRELGKIGELVNCAKNSAEFSSFAGLAQDKVENNDHLRQLIAKALEGESHQIDKIKLKAIDTSSHRTFMITMKNAMRLKSLNAAVLPATPFRYIRSTFERKCLLPKTFSNMYILPTLDEEVKIFIIQLSSERLKKFNMTDLVACLESSDQPPESGHIWFPQFKIDSGTLFNSEYLKVMQSYNQDKPLTLLNRNILEISHPLDKSLLKMQDHPDDAIVKGEFVVGLLSKDLLSVFKIPIFMTLVSKNDFIDI